MACPSLSQRCKPYLAMVMLQIGYAGMNIISKVALNSGASHYVLVVYRHVFATLSTAPFALYFERGVERRVNFSTFMLVFVMGLLGPVIDQNLYYAGLKYTSPTFACAMSNILPAMTFVIAALCRMEKVNFRSVTHLTKVIGTLVTVGGALVMTLLKGPVVHIFPPGSHGTDAADKDFVKGSVFIVLATLAWASLFIIQAYTLRRYSAQLSLTTMICFVGTLQATVVALIMERDWSAWHIAFDIYLFAAAYAGIVTSGLAYYIQGKVIQAKGPVFASAFSPLMMIIVAVVGAFILAENINLGEIIGAILIALGLYSVLWGKYKEGQKERRRSQGLQLEAGGGPEGEEEEEIAGENTSGTEVPPHVQEIQLEASSLRIPTVEETRPAPTAGVAPSDGADRTPPVPPISAPPPPSSLVVSEVPAGASQQ